jgi:photosystem II stability/assembly factor-like uncharacterized protein
MDSLHGWAVGENYPKGIILKTVNGGNTWNIVYQNDSLPLYGIWFNNLNEGWAVGGTGVPGYYIPQRILHTTDGGNTWQIQYNNNSNTNWRSATSVQFIGLKGWVGLGGYADSMGYIIHSENGGNTWTNQATGVTAVDIFNLHFVNEQKGVACGMWNWAYPYDNSGGIVFYTNDGGNSWNEGDAWNPGPVAMGAYNDIWMIGDTGYVAGAADGPQVNYVGIIKKTVNGGQSWTIKRYSTPQQGEKYLGLHFVTPSIGWVGGTGGLILFTYDGGNTWTYDNSNTSQIIWDIHGVTYQIGSNLICYLWAVGSYGTILHLKFSLVSISEKPNNPKIVLNKIPNLFHNSTLFINKNFYLYDVTGKKLKGMNKNGIYFLKNKEGNKKFKIVKF